MNDLTMTEQFGITMSRDVMQAARTLLTNFYIIALSLILLCAAASVIVFRLRVRKPQFLFRRTTPLGFHKVMLAVMLLLTVIQSIHLNSSISMVIFAASIAALIAALFGMLRFSHVGLYAEICFIWLSLPVKELYSVLAARNDFSELSSFSAPGQAGVYAASEYIVFRAIVLEIIAAVLTVIVIGYYARRRYLFSDFARRNFTGLTECPACGIPLVFEGDYCPCCGTDIRHLARSVMTEEPVIIDRHCRGCSKELRDGGICGKCDSDGTTPASLGASLRSAIAEQGKAKLKSFIALAVVVIIAIVPVIVSGPLDYMVNGSAQVNNEFVEKVNEFKSDVSLADDPEWLASFDAAADELYQFDSRSFYIDPSRLDYNDLYAYIGYSEAAYDQMIAIEKMTEAVRAKDLDSLSGFAGAFDRANSSMLSALTGSMSILQSIKDNVFMSVENIIVDSLRFYLSFIDDMILIIVLLSAAGAAVITAVILTVVDGRRKKDDLFAHREYDAGKKQPEELLKKRYKKERAIEAGIAAAAAAVIIGASLIGVLAGPNTPQTLSQASTDLYVAQGAELELWIAENGNSAEVTDEQLTRAESIIEAMLRDIAVISETAPTDEDTDSAAAWDVTEDAEALGRELYAFASYLKSGASYDTNKLLGLITQGMKDQQKAVIEDAVSAMMDMFDD